MNSTKKIYIWLPLWIALSVAVGILIGSFFSIHNSGRTNYVKGDKIDAVLECIAGSYVDSVDIQELIEKALPNLVSELDPHSVYLTAEEVEAARSDMEGHFSGIGVQFRIQQDTVVIVSLIHGGPSEAAGILPGDRIVYVNDSLFVGKTLTNDKVLKNLKGQKGSSVRLGIKRLSQDELLSMTITRDDVSTNSVDVSFSPVDKVGYIKVSRFATTTIDEFISAIAKLKSQGSESFIIDLRQNSGGALKTAIDMANEFLELGDMIVYTEGRSFPRATSFATGTGACKDNQLVVLMDEGSASSSEVFAGAIQDNDRGIILGRRSYGKGLVQTQYPFMDGSALRLTIARYYTPSGRCIQKSYERGNRTDYSQDLVNRFLRGEFDSADSIKMAGHPLFHTLSGRPVYGNDGIMPDIFIPRDTTGINSYYTQIMNRGFLFEYAFMYADQNRERLNKFTSWQEMSKYLSMQPLVQNLVSYAENKGLRNRPYLVSESYSLLQIQMEAYIVRDFFGEDGFYPIFLRDDVVLKRAIQLLKEQKASKESIKELRYKEKK